MAARILTTALLGAALAAMTPQVLPAQALPAQVLPAQGKYPDRPVRIILPFGAGGVADVTARLVADKLGEKLGQRFIVENQPGAGGIAAARSVIASPPDGYTLALLSNGTAISVPLFKSLPFDPLKDFAPVSSMGYFDFIFVANAGSPYKTLGDFIKAAKEKPGALNVGTINVGSSQNLSAELFKSTAGIDFVIVPFRGTPDVLVALLRNDVQLAIENYVALKANIADRKMIAVASSGATRTQFLREVPTVQQAGGGQFEVRSWNAIFAPAGTSPDVIKILNQAMREVLATPDVKQKALDLGIEAKASTPEEIAARLKADIEKWTKVIAGAGIPKQ